MQRYFCIHGHFYQPPREDPFTGQVPLELGAEPYNNFNEKITAECYGPNAQVGNFEHISFNLGGTLAAWLARYAPDTYQRIVAADRANLVMSGLGNAVAQSVHHTILPLANERDKRTQVRWGIASFRYRFGHDPLGMWLPEMAVDLPTLQVLADHGIKYTILSPEQLRTPVRGAGPYRVRLDSRRSIAVFVRDAPLSNSLSFDMGRYPNASAWVRERLLGDPPGGLTLVATDGETFGHHHRNGVEFLWSLLTRELPRAGYQVTHLNAYLSEHAPHTDVEVIEKTSWSCWHGLARWSTGCACTEGAGSWKSALRTALTTLADQLDGVFEEGLTGLVRDPWQMRDDYIQVVLGIVRGPQFVNRYALRALTTAQTGRVLSLLRIQLLRQRMYASCTFFFEELTRPEPRYAIANAVRAIQIAQRTLGVDLMPRFRSDLQKARSLTTPKTGADLLDEIVVWGASYGDGQ